MKKADLLYGRIRNRGVCVTKMSMVALVISSSHSKASTLVDTLHDEYEIQYIDTALRLGEKNPLDQVYENRTIQQKKENEFGDYVEELLSRPFVNPAVQKHGIQWFKSKIKIEQFQKTESAAVKVISDYAYKVFQNDPTKTDFILVSPTHQVRVRVFELPDQ